MKLFQRQIGVVTGSAQHAITINKLGGSEGSCWRLLTDVIEGPSFDSRASLYIIYSILFERLSDTDKDIFKS